MKDYEELKNEINESILSILKKRRNVEIDIRVYNGRIQIDIIDLKNDDNNSIYCSLMGNADWDNYVQYVRNSRETIMNIARQFGMEVEIDLIMYGWTRYGLIFN